MDNKINVLMTGAGAPGGPGIISALSLDDRINLHTADMNPFASGKFLSDNFHLICSAESDNYIDEVFDLCKKYKISILFPLVTRELIKLSIHKTTFREKGITIIVSDFQSLSIANNKCSLYQHLTKNEVLVPDYRIVHDSKEIYFAMTELGYPNSAVVMKPCEGNGSRGVRIISPHKNKYSLLFHDKPNSLYMSMKELLEITSNRDVPPLLFSEYLAGEELTIDTFVKNGIVEQILIRVRDSISGGISTAGHFIEDSNVIYYIKEIVATLPSLNGPIGFQVKKGADNVYKLLESNPRIQGTSVAALGAGVNLPLIAVLDAAEIEPPKLQINNNIGFIRYYKEVFYEY